jgi:hypothetical protein
MDEQFQDALTGESESVPAQEPLSETSFPPDLPVTRGSLLQQTLATPSPPSPNASIEIFTSNVLSPSTLASESPVKPGSPPPDTSVSSTTQEAASSAYVQSLTLTTPSTAPTSTEIPVTPQGQPHDSSTSVSQAAKTTTRPVHTLRLHTFRAQLTFGLKPSQK